MSALDDVARELVLLVRGLKALHHETLQQVGLRVELPATAVLTALDERGRLRLSAVAEALHLDLSSVSRQVATLEREGWVSRTRDPADSRAALLELTPAGGEVLGRVRAARVEQLRRRLPRWSAAELADLAATLHRLSTDLRQPVDAGDTARPTDRTPALAGQESA